VLLHSGDGVGVIAIMTKISNAKYLKKIIKG